MINITIGVLNSKSLCKLNFLEFYNSKNIVITFLIKLWITNAIKLHKKLYTFFTKNSTNNYYCYFIAVLIKQFYIIKNKF